MIFSIRLKYIIIFIIYNIIYLYRNIMYVIIIIIEIINTKRRTLLWECRVVLYENLLVIIVI